MNFSIQHSGWGIACDTNEYERAGREGNDTQFILLECFPTIFRSRLLECVAASSPFCQLEGSTLHNLRLLWALFLPQRSSYIDVFMFFCVCDLHYMSVWYANVQFVCKFVFIVTHQCLPIQIWGNGWYKMRSLGILIEFMSWSWV